MKSVVEASVGTQQREWTCSHPHPTQDFASLVGAAGWARLSPAIRARFSAKGAAASVTYDGVMEAVRGSLAGLALAQLGRLVGTPLAPWRGSEIPVSVRVYETADAGGILGGIVWERVYRFPGRAPVTVRSTKVMAPDGALLECVGGGFGMRLKVFEQNGKLHFLSTRYFWQCGPWRIPLPRLLTPGTAHVVHTDEGGGLFRFTMTFQHPILGETYFQDGVFKLRAVAPARSPTRPPTASIVWVDGWGSGLEPAALKKPLIKE